MMENKDIDKLKNYIMEVTRKHIENMDLVLPSDNPLAFDLCLLDKGIITEGYYKTYPIHNVIKYVKGLYCETIISIRAFKHGKSYNVEITLPKGIDYTELNKALSLCGYYEAKRRLNNDNTMVIKYEPRYSDEVDCILKEQKYIYHASPIVFKNDILKNGISPRSKNKNFSYPNRVYLFKSFDKNTNEKITPSKLVEYAALLRAGMDDIDNTNDNRSNDNNYTWIIYRIDVAKLPKNIKFYDDTSWNNPLAIWTYDNIPPMSIVSTMEYTLTKRFGFRKVK